MNLLNTMLDTQVPMWVTNSFPIIRIVLFSIIVLSAIIAIIAILFQSQDSAGTDVITGAQESYYSKNKGGSRDGKLKLITIIMASIIVVCAILYFITILVTGGV